MVAACGGTHSHSNYATMRNEFSLRSPRLLSSFLPPPPRSTACRLIYKAAAQLSTQSWIVAHLHFTLEPDSSVGFPAAQLRRRRRRPPATVPICVWQQLNLRPFIHFPKKVKLSNINLRFLFCIWMNSTWLLQRIFLLMRFFLLLSLSLQTLLLESGWSCLFGNNHNMKNNNTIYQMLYILHILGTTCSMYTYLSTLRARRAANLIII